MDIKNGYDVHHKNEIKTDNRLQNLCYLTRSEHRKLHKIGKKLSEYHKEKLIAVHKKKAVYCLELDKVFEGVRIAARELSLSDDSISKCCNGKLKTTGGYHFQFVNV